MQLRKPVRLSDLISKFNCANTPHKRVAYLSAISIELEKYQKSVDDWFPVFLEAMAKDVSK